MKKKILRAAREKGLVTHKGKPIRLTADLSAEILQARRPYKLEKRLDEMLTMLTRINSLEKNINNLMELKNTARELQETYTSFNSQIDQAEERISEIEDQLNEIKLEGKIRKKRVERKEQSLQKIGNYVRRPDLH